MYVGKKEGVAGSEVTVIFQSSRTLCMKQRRHAPKSLPTVNGTESRDKNQVMGKFARDTLFILGKPFSMKSVDNADILYKIHFEINFFKA